MYRLSGKDNGESSQATDRKKKYRWLIIAVCIIGLVMAGVMLYEKIIVEQPQNFNFEEMERDSWETTEADGFSMSW